MTDTAHGGVTGHVGRPVRFAAPARESERYAVPWWRADLLFYVTVLNPIGTAMLDEL